MAKKLFTEKVVKRPSVEHAFSFTDVSSTGRTHDFAKWSVGKHLGGQTPAQGPSWIVDGSLIGEIKDNAQNDVVQIQRTPSGMYASLTTAQCIQEHSRHLNAGKYDPN